MDRKWIEDKIKKSNAQAAKRESFNLDYGSLVLRQGTFPGAGFGDKDESGE